MAEEDWEDRFLLDGGYENKNDVVLAHHLIKRYGDLTKAPGINTVNPKPQFCIKTKTDKGEKVFLNVCSGDHLPTPPEISESELLAAVESDDPSNHYKIPTSLGAPHVELDNAGKGCTVYDIVISEEFCKRVLLKDVFLKFLIAVVLEGLEQKHGIPLDREWIMLKNKKCIGKIGEQYVRANAKPLIMDMGESRTQTANKSEPLKFGIKAPEPKYSIVQEPLQGHPEFLVAEIRLPNIKRANALTLDIGEDRLVLTTRSKIYGLDIYLPYYLLQDECGAQFDKHTKLLTVTMPVQPVITQESVS